MYGFIVAAVLFTNVVQWEFVFVQTQQSYSGIFFPEGFLNILASTSPPPMSRGGVLAAIERVVTARGSWSTSRCRTCLRRGKRQRRQHNRCETRGRFCEIIIGSPKNGDALTTVGVRSVVDAIQFALLAARRVKHRSVAYSGVSRSFWDRYPPVKAPRLFTVSFGFGTKPTNGILILQRCAVLCVPTLGSYETVVHTDTVALNSTWKISKIVSDPSRQNRFWKYCPQPPLRRETYEKIMSFQNQ